MLSFMQEYFINPKTMRHDLMPNFITFCKYLQRNGICTPGRDVSPGRGLLNWFSPSHYFPRL